MAETAREWLARNGYLDEVKKIDRIVEKWKTDGVKTRRNWWQVLAGGVSGKPKVIQGIKFSVIKSIRERMGLSPVNHAIYNSKSESAPQIEKQIRWKGHRKKK
jgi:hypothetical protein